MKDNYIISNQSEIALAKTAMLIRRPISEVFEAFINPNITTKFWFTKSTGKLEAGKQLKWIWEMYDVSTLVSVKVIEPYSKIIIEWGNYENMSTIEWIFSDLDKLGTYVSIINSGFKGSQAEVSAQVSDSTKGFTFVLSGLKALLEHNIQLNLIADAFPHGKISS